MRSFPCRGNGFRDLGHRRRRRGANNGSDRRRRRRRDRDRRRQLLKKMTNSMKISNKSEKKVQREGNFCNEGDYGPTLGAVAKLIKL